MFYEEVQYVNSLNFEEAFAQIKKINTFLDILILSSEFC